MSRIRLTAVLTAGVLAAGATGAGAAPAAKESSATKSTLRAAKPRKIYQACSMALSVQIPADGTTVNTADTSGTLAGSTACGGKLLRGGVTYAPFTVADDGSIHVAFRQYFGKGSLRGMIVLTPDNNESIDQGFTAQSFTGTINVTGGTGADSGVKTVRTGSVNCRTLDSVHYACVERFKVKVPAAAAPKT